MSDELRKQGRELAKETTGMICGLENTRSMYVGYTEELCLRTHRTEQQQVIMGFINLIIRYGEVQTSPDMRNAESVKVAQELKRCLEDAGRLVDGRVHFDYI